jgi:hypothetical protein
MRPPTQWLAPGTKRRFAIALAAVFVVTSGSAACGDREAQDEVEMARQVGKQMDNRQQELEKMQEGY